MKIEIDNFNCIEHLEYELEDKKINYLIGNSGSGKSSIVKAISNDDITAHVPYYNEALIPVVRINGKQLDSHDRCFVYDEQYMNNILISKTSAEEIYPILFDDRQRLDEISAEYNRTINSLNEIKGDLFRIKRNIDTLIFDLKIAYNADRVTYKSTCSIRTIMNNAETLDNAYLKYKQYDSKRIK